MPAPSKDMLAQMVKLIFTGKQVSLPIEWQDMGDLYQDAFDPAQITVAPNSPDVLFRETSLNQYHVDAAKDISDQFCNYIDGICDAICFAIDVWMKMAKFCGIKIMAVCAIGQPGCLTGPDLQPFILAKAPMGTASEQKYSQAIAEAFSSAWKSWQDNLMIPGLPWYPAFATFCAPITPPMANLPIPLIALPSAGETDLSPVMLKQSMEDCFDQPDALHASELFDALSKAFAAVFLQFKTSTVVTNVMGLGPVPTFAPPIIPAGPVVAGDVLPLPGVIK